MNVTTDHANGIAIVRVGESRLMYPLLSEFASVVTQLSPFIAIVLGKSGGRDARAASGIGSAIFQSNVTTSHFAPTSVSN